VPATVLIGPQEHLESLKERADLAEAIAFSDTDALRALDAITRQKPDVVALERMFASTSRGAALINRIRADPSLAGCELRIVAHDAEYVPAGARAGGPPGPDVVVAVAEPAPLPAAPLDQRGTRRAPRYRMEDGVEVIIDGNPATLVDLSVIGAQVVSPTILKPNQRIRMSLLNDAKPVRFSAAIAWAAFELPPRYRAGIEFVDADAEAVARFCEEKKRQT
jgi:hypothetical protein